jgi:hypothetical protein
MQKFLEKNYGITKEQYDAMTFEPWPELANGVEGYLCYLENCGETDGEVADEPEELFIRMQALLNNLSFAVKLFILFFGNSNSLRLCKIYILPNGLPYHRGAGRFQYHDCRAPRPQFAVCCYQLL